MAGTRGEIDYATRRALRGFDEWLEVTGAIPEFTCTYYELISIIEDAVHCGFQQALGVRDLLPSEKAEEELGGVVVAPSRGNGVSNQDCEIWDKFYNLSKDILITASTFQNDYEILVSNNMISSESLEKTISTFHHKMSDHREVLNTLNSRGLRRLYQVKSKIDNPDPEVE